MRSGRGSAVAPPIARGLRERLVAALRPSQGAARPRRALLELWGRSILCAFLRKFFRKRCVCAAGGREALQDSLEMHRRKWKPLCDP